MKIKEYIWDVNKLSSNIVQYDYLAKSVINIARFNHNLRVLPLATRISD